MKSLRSTPQRQLVLNIIQKEASHLTGDECYEIARQIDPKISRGTVYRNLNLLADLGEIRRYPMPEGPDHYDHRVVNHYHFLCRNCYKVKDIDLEYQEHLNHDTSGLDGYVVEWHRLVLVGLCPQCKNQTEKEIENDAGD